MFFRPNKGSFLAKKWEIFVRFGLQLLITVYKVLITDLRASNTLSRTFGDRPEYLKGINFRAHLFSRALIFARTNFREFKKFAKIIAREISENSPFAKISAREIFEIGHSRKYVRAKFKIQWPGKWPGRLTHPQQRQTTQ